MPSPPLSAAPSATARPTFELRPEESRRQTEKQTSARRDPTRQGVATWSLLEEISNATGAEASDPRFFADLSDEIARCVLGAASERGATVELGDLADAALDEILATYSAELGADAELAHA